MTVGRIARSIITRYKTTSSPLIPTINHFRTIPTAAGSSHNNKQVITDLISSLHNSSLSSSIYQRFGISSSASPQPNGKKISKIGVTSSNDAKGNARSNVKKQGKKDSNVDDLQTIKEEITKLKEKVNRVGKKDSNTEGLQTMQDEITKLKDKVLNMYSDMEDTRTLTISEANNLKELKNDMRLLSIMILGSLVFSVLAYDIKNKGYEDKEQTKS